jgi:anti-sigma factor RsiW
VNARILLFEGRRHAEARRLLPWLVNGRLDDDARTWVEQHVAGCSDCRREVEELRLLRSSYLRGDDVAVDDANMADADAGWRRLCPRLNPTGAGRERPWRGRWPDPHWLAALAAQSAAIVVLGILLWRQPTPQAAYRTMGSTPAATTGTLVVLFDPHLAEARLRALVRSNDARIVDGPNATGAYVLAVPLRRVAQVRDALRVAPGVILVESLGPEQPQ